MSAMDRLVHYCVGELEKDAAMRGVRLDPAMILLLAELFKVLVPMLLDCLDNNAEKAAAAAKSLSFRQKARLRLAIFVRVPFEGQEIREQLFAAVVATAKTVTAEELAEVAALAG